MLDYKDLIDRMDGYQVGTLVISAGKALLRTDSGANIPLTEKHVIEIYNDDGYECVSYQEVMEAKTFDGLPGFAGLYARVKQNG